MGKSMQGQGEGRAEGRAEERGKEEGGGRRERLERRVPPKVEAVGDG